MASFFSVRPFQTHYNPKFLHFTVHGSYEYKFLNLRYIQPAKILRVASIHPRFAILLQHTESISKFCTEKFATLLLGSVIFAGCLKSRPVLALPFQKSETVEQWRESRYEKDCDDEQEMMYLKLLQQNPRDIEALKMMVNIRMYRGRSNEVMEYVEKLIEIQPNEIEWRLLQAFCYELMGDFSKAKSLFKNILKQNPLLIRALHGLAMVMHKKHEGRAMFEMLEKALEIARRGKRANEERNIKILVAQMHIVKGDLDEALHKFKDLINENPRDYRPYLCKGIIYSLLNKSSEAEESFEMYRCLVPEEFPQREFLDDIVLAAKMEPKQQLGKEPQG